MPLIDLLRLIPELQSVKNVCPVGLKELCEQQVK